MKTYGYKYIEMWGRELGSLSSYIERECAKAHQDGAPLNAIYKSDGTWRTTDTIANNPLRVRLGLAPLPPEHPVILAVFNGELVSAGDVPQIRFRSLVDAARWAGEKGLASRAIALVGSRAFSEPVTVTLYPEAAGEPVARPGSSTLEEAGYTLADVVTIVTGALGGPEGAVTGVITSEPGADTTVIRMYSAKRLWPEDYPVRAADIKEIRRHTS